MEAAPEDFRCPISLEIMAEPVILWTGQTYDRVSIQRWLDAGHTSCPKTKQELHDDTRLIPNYALRSLIHNWAQQHGFDLRPSHPHCPAAASASDAAAAVRQRQKVEALVRGCTAGGGAQARDAVRELRILAKESKQSRALIAECGGTARLLAVLRSGGGELQAEIEENAVVALLNLSADDENKVGLVAEGAVDAIVHTLSRERSSADSKASAALAVTSLAMVDVNKAIIGRHPGAVPALCRLIASGSPRGKKDGAIALYSLCMLSENRCRAVSSGVIPALLGCIPAAEGEASQATLALLDVVSTACEEGRAELRRAASGAAAVQALVKAMGRTNSVRTRESSAAVLCAVCGEDRRWAALAFEAGAIPRGVEIARTLPAQSRAVRKATKLVQLLQGFVKNVVVKQ